MRLRLLVVLGVLALVGAACSGSGGEVADVASESESETVAQEEGTTDMEMDEHADHDEMGHAEDEGAVEEEASGKGVIEIVMREFAFEPATFEVQAGEPVRFRFVNEGAIEHEAIFGTMEEQMHHAEEMAEGGGHHHDIVGVDLEPGESAMLKHTFTEPGTYIIGCHYAGHWDAGMLAEVIVT